MKKTEKSHKKRENSHGISNGMEEKEAEEGGRVMGAMYYSMNDKIYNLGKVG